MQSLTEEKDTGQWERMEQSAETQFLQKEETAAVIEAVARLPQRYQIPVLLFYMEELSVAQIASVARIPIGTVKSRLYHARKILEKELEVVLNEQRS